jgi:hypothetical protein
VVVKNFMGEGVFMGTTLPEHGLGKRAVCIPAPHYLTCAMTGAGKSITSSYLRSILHRGSLVVISPKPEYVNFALGYRTDPRLFDDRIKLPKGIRRGCDPRGITTVKHHLRNGTCFNFDPGRQSAHHVDGYRLLNDVHVQKPGAVGRLLAIATGSFPDNPQAKDPWFFKAPRCALAATWGHFLTSSNDPDTHTMR